MRYAKKAFITAFIVFLLGVLGVGVWVFVLSPYNLPKGPLVFERLKPPTTSTLFDGNGTPIFYFGRNDPIAFYKPLDQIDKKLRDYVVMLEDAKFFIHKGYDVDEIENSFWKNIQAGKIKRGGSGITQQLAKNLFLDSERSYSRKLFEVPWTFKIESSLSKKQILELYMNSIEWGPDLSGAESAARYFFGKSCSNLSVGEAMYLALIVPSPTRFNLIRNPGAAKSLETKRRWLVNRLVSEKKIPASERDAYMNASFGILPLDSPERQFPAPTSNAFKVPEWATFLKPFAKGRNSKVSILKKVQEVGATESYWTTGGEVPEVVLSTAWCAVQGENLVGYWKFDDEQKPVQELEDALHGMGYEINPCENIDVSRMIKR